MDGRISKEHRLNILDRQKAQVTGINKVLSIEEQQIVLVTDVGKMVITGKGLHAGRLDVVAGELEFTGDICGINYSEYKSVGQKASGIVGRLFK